MTIIVGTNSYISISDATNYFNASLTYSSSWSALDPTTQEQILITAARMIDRQTWMGQKTDPLQVMQWPRINVVDKYGNAINPTAVPQAVIDGQCELGMAIYVDPTVQTNKDNSSNIKSVKGGPAEVQFFRPINAGRFPTVIQELLGQYFGGGLGQSAGLTTGNCNDSKFDPHDPRNDYGVVRGFS